MFFKFINKCQTEILSCAPHSSHVYDFFMLNECNVLSLSNVCHSILFNVNGSHLYQHKGSSNAKHVSVNVGPVYASSVSELVKPLNVNKPVCSSNATKLNTSSVSKFIKQLNVSKC